MNSSVVQVSNLVNRFITDERSGEEIFSLIRSESFLQFILDTYSPRDIVIICFLALEINNGRYKKGLENVMDQFLFSYSVVHFKEQTVEAECESCSGDGVQGCNMCYGEGYNDCHECDASGTETCATCDGSGEDDEGNPCNVCDGNGQVSCGECDGDGTIECGDCDGSGSYDCYECDAKGYTEIGEHIPFRVTTYLSWSPKYREKLRGLAESEKNIGINSTLLNYFISMKIRTADFDYTDNETSEIAEEYQNGTYIGGINEKPQVMQYGYSFWTEDPTPDEKFKG